MGYKGNKTKTIQLRLSPELKQQLDDAAVSEGITRTWWIEEAILRKLEERRKREEAGQVIL